MALLPFPIKRVRRALKQVVTQGRRNRGGRGCSSPPKYQNGGAQPGGLLKYFMAFTEIFGLGGPNILKYLVRGDKILGGGTKCCVTEL